MPDKQIIAEQLDAPCECTVVLSSCGEDGWNPIPGVPTQTIRVRTLREAALACLKYIDEHELRSSEWSGGAVFLDGKQIANVSYNSSVWEFGR